MEDIRWEQRFSNFNKAMSKLEESVEYINQNFIDGKVELESEDFSYVVDEVIPIGFTCKRSGSGPNTIQFAASEFDGLFNNTNFWLRETQQDGSFNYYDIKTTPYNFELPINTPDIIDNTTRFALVFKNTTPRLKEEQNLFNATLSPNPFVHGFAIQLTNPSQEPVTIEIYDMLGKLVEKAICSHNEIESTLFGINLASGIYQAVVTQGGNKQTLRGIKH